MRVLLLLISLTLALFANTMVNVVSFDDVDLYDVRVGLSNYTESAYSKTIYIKPGDVADDGTITFSGGLDSNLDDTPVDKLYVEVSVDGGDTWHRAEGHADWQWKFTPDLNREYETMIRVVELSSEETLPSDTLTIDGFVLTLDEGTLVRDGVLNGKGHLLVPYLSTITNMPNTLPVDLHDLSVEGNTVVTGNVRYREKVIKVKTELAEVEINEIYIAADSSQSHVVGTASFYGVLANNTRLTLPSSAKITATGFDFGFDFKDKKIDIWAEQGVVLVIKNGVLHIRYLSSQSSVNMSLESTTSQLQMGTFLGDGTNQTNFDLMAFTGTSSLLVIKGGALLHSGIVLADNYNLNIDLSDLSDPRLTFEDGVDVTQFPNVIVQRVEDAQITAEVSRKGFNAVIKASSALQPVTIINRGDENSDVRLLFTDEAPSFTITMSNNDNRPHMSMEHIAADITFGDLLQQENNGGMGSIKPIVASLVSSQEKGIYTLNLGSDAFLMGTGMKLPAGMQMRTDLSEVGAPKVSFKSTIDLSNYIDPIISRLKGTQIDAKFTKQGFRATVIANSQIAPIILVERGGAGKDVQIVFNTTEVPSFELVVSGSSQLSSLEMTRIHAQIDFGDMLQKVSDETNGTSGNVLADFVFGEDNTAFVPLIFYNNDSFKLFNSPLVVKGISATFNLESKTIAINGSANLDGYTNPVLKALSTTAIDITVDPSGIEATLAADTTLNTITMLDRGVNGQDVALNISGNPTVSMTLVNEVPTFSFGMLDATLNFGDLFQKEQGGSVGSFTPVETTLTEVDNANSLYSFIYNSPAYLLGGELAFETISGQVDLSSSTIMIDGTTIISKTAKTEILSAFSGASAHLIVDTKGLSGSLSQIDHQVSTVVAKLATKDVMLSYGDSAKLKVTLERDMLAYVVDSSEMSLDFGALFGGLMVDVKPVSKGSMQYQWVADDRQKLFASSMVTLSSLSGTLDLSDPNTPTVAVKAMADLSGYGGFYKELKPSELLNAMITKQGFSAQIPIKLESVDIFKASEVKLMFENESTLDLSVSDSGYSMRFIDLQASIDFGKLLDDATIDIGTIMPIAVKQGEVKEYVPSTDQTWHINGEYRLAGSSITLSDVNGMIDLADPVHPSIMLNATADMHRYGALESIRAAGIENATIDGTGFHASANAVLGDIRIWKDKAVKVTFGNGTQPLSLDVDTNGLRVGLPSSEATLSLGNFIVADNIPLSGDGKGQYQWNLSGEKKISDEDVALSEMQGYVDLSDLNAPYLSFLEVRADLHNYASYFSEATSVSLIDAKINANGFSADLNTPIQEIDIWQEKGLKVTFASENNSLLHLHMGREPLTLGVVDLEGMITFGELLNGKSVPLVKESRRNKTKYTWQVANTNTIIHDTNGSVTERSISGRVDLDDLKNPFIVFNAEADFSDYTLPTGTEGNVTLEDAKISSNGIDWNHQFAQDIYEVTVWERGTKDEDVRLELAKADGVVSNLSHNINGVDGIVYFGTLFEGVSEPIALEKMADGSYDFNANSNKTFTYKDGNDSIVLTGLSGKITEHGELYTITLDTDVDVHATVVQQLALGQLHSNNTIIDADGLRGTIAMNFSPAKTVQLNAKSKLTFNNITLAVNSASSPKISLNAVTGTLGIASAFDESSNSAPKLAVSAGKLTWKVDEDDLYTIADWYLFKALHGEIALDATETVDVALKGELALNAWQIDRVGLSISGDNFTIDGNGVHGTKHFLSESGVSGAGVKVKKFDLAFGEHIAGSLDISYTKANFLKSNKTLSANLSAILNEEGLQKFKFKGALPKLTIASFAEFSFSDVETPSVVPTSGDFWLNTSGTVKPLSKTFTTVQELSFQDLNISKEGISISGGGVDFDTTGTEATLGGLSVSVTTLGLGIDKVDDFYIHAKGEISLDMIASNQSAGADLKVYKDKVTVEEINATVNTPMVAFKGSIKWFENDPVYGSGYKATELNFTIVELFKASGEFYIGSVSSETANYPYFFVGLGVEMPAGIPLGSLPISLYGVKGGLGYGMSYVALNHKFVPSLDTNFLFKFGIFLGSTDDGYTWNADTTVIFDTGGQLSYHGIVYPLTKRLIPEDDKKNRLEVDMTISDSKLWLRINAQIDYKILKLDGKLDLNFEESDKHIYVGTDRNDKVSDYKPTVDLGHAKLEIFNLTPGPWVYYMLDFENRYIALGAGFDFDKKISYDWWGPDPWVAIVAKARMDGSISYGENYYMMISGDANVGLGVGYGDVGGWVTAGLRFKVRAPNPTFLWLEAYVDIPVKGEMGFDMYIPEKPENADAAPPLIVSAGPSSIEHANMLPDIRVLTSIPMEEELEEDDGSFFKGNIREITLFDLEDDSREPQMKLKSLQNNISIFTPARALVPGHEYRVRTSVVVYVKVLGRGYKEIKSEVKEADFKVDENAVLEFSEVIDHISPADNARISADEHVRVYYSHNIYGLNGVVRNTMIDRFRVDIIDATGTNVPGTFGDQGFIPNDPLRVYYFCKDTVTGEIRETFKNFLNQYLNPFRGYTVDSEEDSTENSSQNKKDTSVTVPSRINKNNLTGVSLGDFVHSSVNRYSYFVNDEYSIKVVESGRDNVVYHSSFKINSNNVEDESLRRFDRLKQLLKPTVYIAPNLERPGKEYKLSVGPDLSSIGVKSSLYKIELKTIWRLAATNAQDRTITRTLRMAYSWGTEYALINFGENGYYTLQSAEVTYINLDTQERYVALQYTMESRQGYSPEAEAEARERSRQELQDRVADGDWFAGVVEIPTGQEDGVPVVQPGSNWTNTYFAPATATQQGSYFGAEADVKVKTNVKVKTGVTY